MSALRLPVLSLCWLLMLAGLAGCQRGARIELELVASAAFADSHLLAMPTAVELIDARGLLFRLPVARPLEIDLVTLAAAPLQLSLRGQLPAGRYIGLRLVFEPTVWFERPGGLRAPLPVDPRSAFADLDLDLAAGSRQRLMALLDLDASVIRLGPFQDLQRFQPRLSLVAGQSPRRDAGSWAPAAAEVAALSQVLRR